MDRKEFNKLLEKADLTKKKFAEIVGMKYNSVFHFYTKSFPFFTPWHIYT